MYRIRQQTSRCGYARLLGFRQESSWVLTSIKKNTGIPVISKLSQPAGIDIHMLEQNIFASDLYESVVTDKYHTPYKNEYQKQIIRLKS